MVDIRLGDCLELMKDIPDGSVDLVLTDIPYNMGKAKWDVIDRYDEWIVSCVLECQRILKPNGCMYMWHNDVFCFGRIVEKIKSKTDFVPKSFIVYDKPDVVSRKLAWANENEKLNNWFNKCEYLYYFEKPNLFSRTIREEMKKRKLKEGDFRRLKASRNGNPTGWCSNIILGKNIPTEEDWKLICTLIGEHDYKNLKVTHNADKNHCNIVRSDVHRQPQYHICEKPIDVLERIIKVSSNDGETVLDFTAGSMSTVIACINTNRNCIAIEKDEHYFSVGCERVHDYILDNDIDLCYNQVCGGVCLWQSSKTEQVKDMVGF